MEHRIERRDAFRVVGVRGRFAAGRIEGIPALWHRFCEVAADVPHRVPGPQYGVCIDDRDGAAEEPGFHYMACCEVSSLDDVPEGLHGFTVPGGTFAVFTCRGPISAFPQKVRRIWREAIPAAGLKPTGAPDLEVYGERFRGEEDDSEVDVWVPVAV